jgi:hypothetical protein
MKREFSLLVMIVVLSISGCGDEVVPTDEYSTPESIPAPTELRVFHSARGAYLFWQAPDSDFELVQGWHVYKETPDGMTRRITNTPIQRREYEDTEEPVVGITRYTVVALSWGNVESLESNPSSFVYDENPPSPPTDLRASPQPGHIILQWLQGIEQDLASYTVFRDSVAVAFINDPAMPVYFDVDVVTGVTYTYFVTVTDFSGFESGPSNEVSAATLQ